ncbi:hypothetical protein GOBAR_DD33966 [Gossypium barbadense]|nr:hypothetical protein GOBAR_DD33966 [Gossypium barbadense]
MVSNGCFLGMINSSFTLKNDTYPVVIHSHFVCEEQQHNLDWCLTFFRVSLQGKTAGRGHNGRRDREGATQLRKNLRPCQLLQHKIKVIGLGISINMKSGLTPRVPCVQFQNS